MPRTGLSCFASSLARPVSPHGASLGASISPRLQLGLSRALGLAGFLQARAASAPARRPALAILTFRAAIAAVVALYSAGRPLGLENTSTRSPSGVAATH